MRITKALPLTNSVCAMLLGTGLTVGASALSVPVSDSTYLQWGDLTTFNFRILNQKLGTPIPATPTGTSDFIRMFSNGNLNNNPSAVTAPIKWNDGAVAGPLGKVNIPTDLSFLWGIDYANGLSSKVTTTDDVLSVIQSLSPGSVNPVFGFDQSQSGGGQPPLENRDLLLKARLLLVSPSIDLLGESSASVGAAIAGALPAELKIFTLNDPGNVYPFEDALGEGDDWVFLPGEYSTEGYVANNNVGGAEPDWGGFIPNLDLTQYKGWSFLVEMQGLNDTNGPEEAYILGGLSVVPSPMAFLPGVTLLTGLVLLRRRTPA